VTRGPKPVPERRPHFAARISPPAFRRRGHARAERGSRMKVKAIVGATVIETTATASDASARG
jgi:hypothetical protein